MKNKFIKASFFLLFTIVLSSCKSENVEPRYVPLLEMSSFSLSIDGKESSVKNTEKRNFVIGGYGEAFFKQAQMYGYTLQYYALIEDLKYGIAGSFFPLAKAMYKISNTDIDFASQQTQIYVYKLEENNTKQQVYLPLKNEFSITISSFERIEGKSGFFTTGEMAGILYNPENLQDSIIIENGKFVIGR